SANSMAIAFPIPCVLPQTTARLFFRFVSMVRSSGSNIRHTRRRKILRRYEYDCLGNRRMPTDWLLGNPLQYARCIDRNGSILPLHNSRSPGTGSVPVLLRGPRSIQVANCLGALLPHWIPILLYPCRTWPRGHARRGCAHGRRCKTQEQILFAPPDRRRSSSSNCRDIEDTSPLPAGFQQDHPR